MISLIIAYPVSNPYSQQQRPIYPQIPGNQPAPQQAYRPPYSGTVSPHGQQPNYHHTTVVVQPSPSYGGGGGGYGGYRGGGGGGGSSLAGVGLGLAGGALLGGMICRVLFDNIVEIV